MLALLLAIPIVTVAFVKFYLKATYTWKEAAIHLVVVCALMIAGSEMGKYASMSDTEILNGKITGKKRVHDQYTEYYDCNCTTTGSGSSKTTTCQTCTREHYTVDWLLHSTIGNYTVKSLDSLSSSVYSTPDPRLYRITQKGDPCSKENTYLNYFRATPNSLQSAISTASVETYRKKGLLPKYPHVYSLYKVKRVLDPGNKTPSGFEDQLSEHLSLELRELGAIKQVNILAVIAPTSDRNYRYALEQHWLGGKKNDVVVVMGVTDYPKVEWADVITLAGNTNNEMLAVKLRDDIENIGDLSDTKAVSDVITGNVKKHFNRMPMAEWEHLKEEYTPPFWLLITLVLVNIALNAAFTWYFHRNDVKPTRR